MGQAFLFREGGGFDGLAAVFCAVVGGYNGVEGCGLRL